MSEYRYHGAGFTNPSVQQGLDRLIIDAVTGVPGGNRVCDIGCGNGRLVISLAESGSTVVGVDASASGIDIARRSARRDLAATFVQADIDPRLSDILLRFGGAFDVVVSVDVIEHLFQPRLLVETAWRILRPGGRFVVCTPYHGYFKNVAISVLGKWDAHHDVNWDGGHIKFFSVRTLSAAVTQCGFAVEGFRFFGRAPLIWKNMVCIAVKPDRPEEQI
jgi:2-polyprenyl-3-methyl-5-hydroxy-6-metoxy-1,4-benzoquinol methylase